MLPRILYKICRLYWFLRRPLTVGVRLLLIRDNNILLVKHTYQRHWYLPGGGVKKGETLVQAAQREGLEELGAELGDLYLLGCYTNFYDYKNDHVVVYVCHDFNVSGQTDGEIEKFSFFPIDNLPDDVSPGSTRRIKEYQRCPVLSTLAIERW